MSLARCVIPGFSARTDFPLESERAALLVIDIQKYLSQPRTAEERAAKSYFFDEACPAATTNIAKLSQAFRLVRDKGERGSEVIFTYLQAATSDGRDISLDYKLSGPDLTNIPRSTTPHEDLFLDNLKPDTATGKGDILLPKTSCNVFISTNIDYMLHNLGIEQLVICGQLTDECVESAVRSAADRGYFVTVVEDACASLTPQKHAKGLDGVKGFARVASTAQVLEEVVDSLAADVGTGSSGHKKSNGATASKELTEENVLSFLRRKGLHKVAKQIDLMFMVQGLSSQRDKKEENKKTEDGEPKSPRRSLSPRRRVKRVQKPSPIPEKMKLGDSNGNLSLPESPKKEMKEKLKLGDSNGNLSLPDPPTKEKKESISEPKTPTATPSASIPKSPHNGLPPPPLSPNKSPKRNRRGTVDAV